MRSSHRAIPLERTGQPELAVPLEETGRPDLAGRLVDRRRLFTAGAGGLAALSLSGCGFFSTDPSGVEPDGSGDGAAKGKEAPDLANQVEAGELPPVDQRLPAEPLVVQPIEGPGKYGGTWQAAILGTGGTGRLERSIGYECLLRWSPTGWEPQPNVAKSWEVSDDGRTFTFVLREGMKWSDGEPFTADDIVFAYDDVLANSTLNPVPVSYFVRDGKPGELKKLDDYTVEFSFVHPHALFPSWLSYHPFAGRALVNKPRHYLEQFHPDYADDVESLAKEEGFSDWPSFFLAKADESWNNVEIPTICAWQCTNELGKGTAVNSSRNPYYWKTDPDGSQLPYIDQVRTEVIDDAQVMLLKASNGELDLSLFTVNTLENKPVLADNREKGGYKFVDLTNAVMNYGVIALNMTHQDKALAAMFADQDVRIGLSHAIDRNEIINAVLQRQGKPWQAAPLEQSAYYNEELATQYTEFNVDLANDHLDRAGLNRRDGDGWRLRPDGKRATFRVDLANPSPYPQMVGIMELVEQYWKDVGIDVKINTIDRTLFVERRNGNQHEANIWPGGGGLDDAILDPYWYLPFQPGSSYGVPWATWFTSGGKTGSKPPEPAQEQMRLYRELEQTPDPEQRTELLRQILQIAQQQFYAIGIAAPTEGYGVVTNRLHNVPDTMIAAATFYTPGPTNPEQYFIEPSTGDR